MGVTSYFENKVLLDFATRKLPMHLCTSKPVLVFFIDHVSSSMVEV